MKKEWDGLFKELITVSVIDELGDEAQYSISRGQVITVPTVPVWGR